MQHDENMGEQRLAADGAMAAERCPVRRQPADDELLEAGTAAMPRIRSETVGNAGMIQMLNGRHLEAGPVATQLLALQRQLGNHAVVTLLRSPGPSLTGPPTVSSIGSLVEKVLARIPAFRDENEFAEALAAAALRGAGTALTADRREAVERLAYTALGQSVTVGDTTYDIFSALKGLSDAQQAGNSDENAADPEISYGLRLVTSMLAEHIGDHVLTAVTPSITPGDTLAFIADDLGVAVAALTDASSMLDLELEGTTARLTDVRAEFPHIPEGGDRAAKGAEIGRLARRALLLDRELTALGKTAPLDAQLAKAGPRIAAIRSQAQTEHESMKAMDADLSLLGENLTPVRSPDYGLAADAKIQPEEAFPSATDSASNEFMDVLATRLEGQAKELEGLKDKVVPTSPTWKLDELSQVHARWFAFFSTEQEKRDMALVTAWRMLDQGWNILGNAAIPMQAQMSAAIIRAQMLSQFSGFLGNLMGLASSQFSGEIHAPTRAEPPVGGSALHPNYSFGEVQPEMGRNLQGNVVPVLTPVVPVDARGESGSRASYVRAGSERTAREFSGIAKDPHPSKAAVVAGLAPDDKPILGLRSTGARDGWSYLIDVRDLMASNNVVARQHKVMPAEVADYLVAVGQHAATRARTHRPKANGRPLGEAAIRRGGVEAGEGTAAARYLHGVEQPKESASATQLRGQMQKADERIKQGGGKGPTKLVIDDLERYLDAFFVENQSKGVRVAAILLIAQRERNVGAQLFALLNPEVLQKLIGDAIRITVIMNVLQRLGPIGNLAAFAYGIYLRSQGVSNVAALIGVATFLWEASSTDDFREARAFALVSEKIMGDATELLENLLTKPIEIGIGKLADEVAPTGARETADALAPILKDPATRKALIDGANEKIAELEAAEKLSGQPSPELQGWRAFRHQIDGVDRRGDPMPFTEVPLTGISGPGKTPSDTAFAEQARSVRSTKALHEGLGDLTGKVAIVENPDPSLGRTVRVHYDDGKVRLEVGPEAGKVDVQRHYETAKILYSYQRPLGRLKLLIEKASNWLTGHPLYGTTAFEARLEVRKLRAMIDEMNGEKTSIEARAARIGADPTKLAVEVKELDARIEDLDAQLKYHETQVNNVTQGRGWVAAEDRSRVKPKFSTAQDRPSRIAALTDATLLKKVVDPDTPQHPAAHAELQRRFRDKYGSMPTPDVVRLTRASSGRPAWYVADLMSTQAAAGERRPLPITEYLDPSMPIAVVRESARFDRNAAQALVRRYDRDYSQIELEAMAANGDGTAQNLIGQVVPPPGKVFRPLDPAYPPAPQPTRRRGMDPRAEGRLTHSISEWRGGAIEAAERQEAKARAAGDDPAIAAAIAARHAAENAGTLGALETDIPGIGKHLVRGSPEAPRGPTPKGPPPRTFRPTGNQPRQAQFHAEEQLLNDLAQRIRNLKLKPKHLDGKRVRIAVDQEVCSVCAAGGVMPGVLRAFSGKYSGLTIEVTDIRSGHYDEFKGGNRTAHHPVLGKTNAPRQP